jgi:alpha-L-fucosidase
MMGRRDLLRSWALTPLALAAGRRAFGQQNRYQPTWESLDRRPSPAWYPAAKFGIFIHWGVYSVPAYAAVNVKDENPYAEWYWNSLTEGMKATAPAGHGALTWKFHQRVYGANFPYFDFAPLYRAELYDPDRWVDVFVRSGAKYVALTSKHHEGFTLWRSAEANRAWGRPWNSVDIGPRRDLLLDLMEAGRRRDLRMGIYYSLYEWYNPLWLRDRQRYAAEHMFPQFKDVVTHAKPSIIFSDGEWETTSAEWRAPELLAWLFNESPVRDEVVINDRWGKETRHRHGGYFTTEYTPGMTETSHPWEENRGMGYSYGYNRMESLADYRTDRELLMMLIDIVSRGGNLLLDIGPTGDGQHTGDYGGAADPDRRLAAPQRRSHLQHARPQSHAPVEPGQGAAARGKGLHVGLTRLTAWSIHRPPDSRASRPSSPPATAPYMRFCRAARCRTWCWTASQPPPACA